MEEKSLETPCTPLRAVRVGAAASLPRARNPLSQGSWPFLCQPICGYLGSTLPGGTGIKDSETALRKLVGS